MSEIVDQILQEKKASFDSLDVKRVLWTEVEKLMHNELNDTISLKGENRVFDPRLSTLIIERAYRVMAQLPTGKVKAISKNDVGASKLMNLTLEKYVVPQANAQFDFLTKLRMVDLYSNVYGVFFVLVDWDVKQNGYVGPDMWMLNIRDVFPQVGAVSLEDSDYVIVRTWQPLSYFEGLKGQKGYKNIPEIIEKLKTKAGSKHMRDSDSTSARDQSQFPQQEPARKAGYFEVLSKFARDRWIDICVDADLEFRDQPNPHEDGDLPVVAKYSMPLIDDIMGQGDAERGMSMQMAINSNWNYYFKGVQLSSLPPVAIDKTAVAAESSIRMLPAARWFFRGPVTGAVQPINVNPRGIETFNNTHQVANAALLNLFGTTDTAVTKDTDAGYGKTPQALQMQQQRENTRDNADRFYMEQFVTKVMKKMVNLISKKQNKAISIRLFGEEIEQLKRDFPEIEELYDETSGKLTVGSDKTGSILYDYEIVSGSTFALDQKAQQENLAMLMELYRGSQTPQGNILVSDLDQAGFKFNFGELMKRVISNSGIQDWDKILVEKTEQEKGETILNNDAQVFQQQLAQMQMGGGINQVPPQPQAAAPMEGAMA